MSEPSARNTSPGNARDPHAALQLLRGKLVSLAREYSAGKLNQLQFDALYRHYNEKRTIIEKLIERDPTTDAWRAAASSSITADLRDRFRARAAYCLILQRGSETPLMAEGKLTRQAARQMHKMLQVVWKMKSWRTGLARKSLGGGAWLLLAMGDHSLTMVVYYMQPSPLQISKLRDLHHDFEAANATALQNGLPASRMVFPQRAMLENS